MFYILFVSCLILLKILFEIKNENNKLSWLVSTHISSIQPIVSTTLGTILWHVLNCPTCVSPEWEWRNVSIYAKMNLTSRRPRLLPIQPRPEATRLRSDFGQVGVLFSAYFLYNPTPTLMTFTGVTNAHGTSPQPTTFRSPTCSLTSSTGSNQTSPEKFPALFSAHLVHIFFKKLILPQRG